MTSDIHERVVRIIEANTGGPNQHNDQPAALRVAQIGVICGTSNVHPNEMREGLRQARDAGDVYLIIDERGRDRYVRNDEESLRALLAELNQDPDRYEVGRETVADWIREVDR